jgi:predicted nuclease of predicted toxin-antitoxin system
VRLLLDAHVSGPRVGVLLREKGHDVRAIDQEPELEGLADEDVLAFASEEQRILVTHNIRDFPEIARGWMEAQRPHAGLILVYGIDHREFQLIAGGVRHWLELCPEPADWIDLAAVLDRGFASGRLPS